MTHLFYSLLGILNAMSPYILLGFFVAGILHIFVPAGTLSRHLNGHGLKPVVKAALFGIPLPLCSCGVLPTAVALRRQGASKGASTSFLIATPQTGVDSIAATYSLLGLPFAIIRPVAALIGAVAGGWAVDRSERAGDASCCVAPVASAGPPSGFFAKCRAALAYGFVDMVASVGKWLVIGLVVAALITVFVPEELFVGLSRYPLLAMLAVVVVAIPMYICATGSIPVAMSLMMKGLSPGIAFVMLMAGPAANFASLIILGKTQGRRATAVYVAAVTLTAIVFGLLIDLVMPAEWFVLPAAVAGAFHAHAEFSIFEVACTVLLAGLLVVSPFISRRNNSAHNINNTEDMGTITIKVEGMSCPHCKKRVEEVALSIAGTESATVDLSKGLLTVTGTPDRQAIVKAVELAGYNPVD